jgi:hypothetical protein
MYKLRIDRRYIAVRVLVCLMTLVFFNIGLYHVFALLPTPEVNQCLNIPENERTERCRELAANFEKTLEKWQNENDSFAITNNTAMLAAGTLIGIFGLAFLLYSRNKKS